MCQTLVGKHLCGSSHLICTTSWEVGTVLSIVDEETEAHKENNEFTHSGDW